MSTVLSEAMTFARELIITGTELTDAVAEAAAEYELNPALVTRKLVEQHGAPADQLADVLRQRARDASKCTLPPPAPPLPPPTVRQRAQIDAGRAFDRALIRLFRAMLERTAR